MTANVLVVEDDHGVRDLVRRYLERDGFCVLATASGAQAVDWLERGEAHLAVVDLGLPDVPGEEVLAVAAITGVPVVVLSSRAAVEDRIQGLELGAADYVGKPFSPRELVLRVKAVLARSRPVDAPSAQTYDDGRLVVNQEDRTVRLDGEPVELTRTEWALLLALLSHPGRVYTREELAAWVHSDVTPADERTITSHIRNLRGKLNESASDGRIVQTVQGFGYRSGVRRDP